MKIKLEKIKTYLEDDQEIPSSTAQRFHRISNEIKRKRKEVEGKIRKLAGVVEENLEQHQLYQLQEFIPCIIPPQGELRIDQAGNNKGLARNLERIREIPYRTYERRKAEIVDRTLQGLKLHIPRGVEIKDDELEEHIQKVFRKARSLSDIDFEIQKERLSEEFVSVIKPSHSKQNVSKTIQTFLLCPEIIPILEERILSLLELMVTL